MLELLKALLKTKDPRSRFLPRPRRRVQPIAARNSVDATISRTALNGWGGTSVNACLMTL